MGRTGVIPPVTVYHDRLFSVDELHQVNITGAPLRMLGPLLQVDPSHPFVQSGSHRFSGIFNARINPGQATGGSLAQPNAVTTE